MAVIPSLLRTARAPRARGARVLDAAVWLFPIGGAFLQQPGRTTFDTKFDLTADPVGFLERSLHLWNPQASLGELQNQAYGYLFPQGPFFVIGHLLHLPDWVTQRLWCAVLLVAAYEGAKRLARALDIGPSWACALAGLAYAETPRLLSEVGTLTGEIVPTVVLPWVLLPLIQAQQGRRSVRSAAMLSGVAVLFMGGLNAVENLAALPLAFLVVLASSRAIRWRLTAWWVGAVAMASLWWLLPLFVLGRYSPPFLDYIETSQTTTQPLGLANVVRGSDHWLQFFSSGGRPWWPAGFALANSPLLVAAAAIVAAIGLVGLCLRGFPGRLPFLLSAALGLLCLYAGHAGALGSPVASWTQSLLDGPLAAFRNVHKVDPLVRLPLALGFGYAAARAADRVAGLLPRIQRGGRPIPRLTAGALVGVLLGGLLLVAGKPLWSNELRSPGWSQVPTAWTRTADYLAKHADERRALVLPGSGFGVQTWGTTIDEPMQGLAKSPWITRGQVPLAPGQTIRFLDAIETRISDGTGSPALAEELSRSGIGYVVARHDLNLAESDAPPRALVDAALGRSPGLDKVASYGHAVGGGSLIDIYRVDRPVPLAQVTDLSATRTLAGSADDVMTALESGAVGVDVPFLTVAGRAAGAVDYVADGLQRRERQFGRAHASLSAPMTLLDPFRLDRPRHDYDGTPGQQPAYLDAGQVVSATASSSAGYADALGPVRPQYGPYAALDDDGTTEWRSAPYTKPVGQWLDLHLTRTKAIGTVTVRTENNPAATSPITQVQIRAGAQTRSVNVDPVTGIATVTFPQARTKHLRITVTGVKSAAALGVIGIRDVHVDGLKDRQELVVPPTGTGDDTTFLLRADPGVRACIATFVGPSCDLNAATPPEADVSLARRFTLETPEQLDLSGTVVARSTQATATLTEPLGDQVKVVPSSVLGQDPSVSGQFAFDSDITTTWVAAPGDTTPSLQLSWKGERTLKRLQVVDTDGGTVPPTSAVLTSGDQSREVSFSSQGLGFFEPLRTDHVTVTFPAATGDRPLGISELKIPALTSLTYRPSPDAASGGLCGFGPTVYVDGTAHRTRVTGSLGAVVNGLPMDLQLCGGSLDVDAGVHHISVAASSQFAPVLVTLGPKNPAAVDVVTRDTTITSWGDTHRVLTVAAGDQAVLRVPENVNPGWRATLGGKMLKPQPVDGWQQGWVVPAGAGGRVVLDYTPDATYRTVLILGLLVAVLLMLAGIVFSARDRDLRFEYAAPGPTGRRTHWLVGAATAVVVGVVLGPLPVVALVVAGAVGLRWAASRPWLLGAGSGLVALSGLVSALSGDQNLASSPWVANAAAGAGVAALVAAAWLATRRDRGGSTDVGPA